MKWLDLFYFSKGERRALILLLFLVVGAWITVVFTRKTESGQVAHYISAKDSIINNDTVRLNDRNLNQKTSAFKKERREFYKPWVGPKKGNSSYTRKFAKGTVVEINSADTTVLKGVPGIGSTFANRIVKYRNLLGGFCHIEQLKEVYGIDEAKYELLKDWFSVDTAKISKIQINILSAKELAAHPYISFSQAEVMLKLRKRKGKIKSWDELRFLEEFQEDDYIRLCSYISFDAE